MYEYRAEVIRWVDGDTVELRIDLGFGVSFVETCRLAGIDTPETHRRKKNSPEWKRGKAAEAFSESYAPRGSRVLIKTERDRSGKYGRTLVELWRFSDVTEETLNERLVKAGHAVVSRK